MIKRKDINMEEKILIAIKHIRWKCQKRVMSQRIYSFINKGALCLESNSFQDFMVGLEIVISKEVRENLLRMLLERNLWIPAVIKSMKTQIMGYHCSKMYHLPLKQLRRHAKILKMKILS